MAARFVFRTGAATDVGKVRKLNEDSLSRGRRSACGRSPTAWAATPAATSRAAKSSRRSATIAKPASAAALLADFERAIGETNLELRRLARERGNAVIGSTLAAVLIFDEHFACVWCGDSRVYLLREGALRQVSRDHSEVQDLIDRGVLDREEAKTWPRRNVVTRALGVVDAPELEISDGRALPGDRFLLCSDGLTAHVADDEIAGPLGGDDPQKACDALVALTLQRGASDNVSVVIVICDVIDDRTVRDDAAWRRALAARVEPKPALTPPPTGLRARYFVAASSAASTSALAAGKAAISSALAGAPPPPLRLRRWSSAPRRRPPRPGLRFPDAAAGRPPTR